MMHPYDDDEMPVTRYMRERQAQRNFVTPAPAPLATRPQTIDAPAWLATSQPVDLATAWAAVDGARENTSAMDRARALRVRLLPFACLWALLGVIVGVLVLYIASNAPGAAMGGLLVFTALTSATYIKLNGQDYAHSREGTERHRVDSAVYLAERQMENDQELKKMALDAYLKQMENRNR